MTTDTDFASDVHALYFYFMALRRLEALGLWCQPLVVAFRDQRDLLTAVGYQVYFTAATAGQPASLAVFNPAGGRPSVSLPSVPIMELVDRHRAARPPTAIPRPWHYPVGCEYAP